MHRQTKAGKTNFQVHKKFRLHKSFLQIFQKSLSVFLIFLLLFSGSPIPAFADTDADADGLPDDWEIQYFGDITTYDQYDDPDRDGVPNFREVAFNTNPTVGNGNIGYDTDGDGVNDDDEIRLGSDPTNPISMPVRQCDNNTDPLNLANGLNVLFVDQNNCDCRDNRERPEALNPATPWCSLRGLTEYRPNHKLNAGDTVYIRHGDYTEHLVNINTSGAGPSQRITIQAYPSQTEPSGYEPVTIRGGNYNFSRMITFNNTSYITIKGFNIVGYEITPENERLYTPMPLGFVGSPSNIIQDIEILDTTISNFQGYDDIGYGLRFPPEEHHKESWGDSANVNYATNVKIRNSNFSCSINPETAQPDNRFEGDGLQLNYVTNATVEDSYFGDCGHVSLSVRWSDGVTLQNNTCSNKLHTCIGSAQDYNVIVRNNLIYNWNLYPSETNLAGIGIEFNQTSDSEAYNNILYYDVNIPNQRDNIGIVTIGHPDPGFNANRNLIYNNLIYMNDPTVATIGSGIKGIIFTDRGNVVAGENYVHDNRIYNNIVQIKTGQAPDPPSSVSYGFLVNRPLFFDLGDFEGCQGCGNEIKNNILITDNPANFVMTSRHFPSAAGPYTAFNYTIDSLNDLFGNGAIVDNIGAEPSFVDLSTYDFHPTEQSSAVDAGVCVPETNLDFDGTIRPQGVACDIGPFEYTYNDNTDMDQDGLPDNWELFYFGNLDQGPDDDPDFDNLTNLQEYQGGTNPTINNGAPVLNQPVSPNQGNFNLTWSAAAGASLYQVQISPDPTFQNSVTENWPSGTFEPLSITETGTFYARVQGWTAPPQDGGTGTGFSNVVEFTVDRVPPTGSIIINHGGARTTRTRNVVLTLSATDLGGSYVANMQFSEDGTNWSSPVAFSPTLFWQLADGPAGTRKVYVRYIDALGNISTDETSDSITYQPLGVSCTGGCDDQNICTTDSCDPLLGCQNTPIPDCVTCATGSSDPQGLANGTNVLFIDQNNCDCSDNYSRSQALSPNTPWCSPVGLNGNQLTPGDTVYFRGGDYPLINRYVTILSSGTESERIYFKPYPGETATIRGGRDTYERTLIFNNVHFITIDGLHFVGNVDVGDPDGKLYGPRIIEFSNSSNIEFNNVSVVDFKGTDDIAYQSRAPYQSWGHGIHFYGSNDIAIRNSYFRCMQFTDPADITDYPAKYSGDAIIMDYVSDSVVENNTFRDCGHQLLTLRYDTHDVIVQNNDFSNVMHTNIATGVGAHHNTIRNNKFHTYNSVPSESSLRANSIQILGGSDHLIYNNLIYNGALNGNGISIANSQDQNGPGTGFFEANNNKIFHNTVYNTGYANMSIGNNGNFGQNNWVNGNQIKNNIFYGYPTVTGEGQTIHGEIRLLGYDFEGQNGYDNVIENNLIKDFNPAEKPMFMQSTVQSGQAQYQRYSLDEFNALSFAENNAEGDPLFVNSAAGDFHLQQDSPAINSVPCLPEVATDFDGNPRTQSGNCSAGAFEYSMPEGGSCTIGSSDPQGIANGTSVLFIDQNNCDCSDNYSRAQALNPNTPWCTPRALRETASYQKLNIGDTVHIRGGDYYLPYIDANNLIVIRSSGAPSNPITIRGYPGETINIHGSSMTQQGSNLGIFMFVTYLADYITFDSLNLIGHINTDTGRLYSPYVFGIQNSNNIELKNISVSAFSGNDDIGLGHRWPPGQSHAEPWADGIKLNNVDGILFDNLNLSCTADPSLLAVNGGGVDGVLADNARNVIVRNSWFGDCGHVTVGFRNSENILIENNTLRNRFHTSFGIGAIDGNAGVSRNTIIRNNIFFGVNEFPSESNHRGGSIQIGPGKTEYIFIYNNLIYDGFNDSTGITLVANVASQNLIREAYIFNNTIYSPGPRGIYIANFNFAPPDNLNSISEIRVWNNILMDANHDYFSPSSFGNTFNAELLLLHYHSLENIDSNHNGYGDTFKNNLIYSSSPENQSSVIKALKDGGGNGQIVSSGLYTAASFNNFNLADSNIQADPLFVDLANSDFHLQPASPANSSGMCLSVIENGFNVSVNAYTDAGCHIGAFAPSVSLTCGSATIEGPEQCDDGNTTEGDGCSSICIVEGGWECTGEPSVCEPGPPTLSHPISPNNGEFDLAWTVALNTAIYQVQISPDPTFQNNVDERWPSGTFEPINYQTSGTFYARVQGWEVPPVPGPIPQIGQGATGFSNIVQFIVDADSPAGFIQIENDEPITYELRVALNLLAIDVGGSTVATMQFTNYENVWSDPAQPYASEIRWRLLTGPSGPRTVYARFFDAVGNVSETVQASIDYEAGWNCTDDLFLPGEGTPECNPICGDGLVVGDEQCDDNNTISGDGCSATCTSELTITATAGPNGTISPAGVIPAIHHSEHTFEITPNPNHHIVDVVVDNVSVGAVPSYTFQDITTNHTIHATFAIDTYTITLNNPQNGTINLSPNQTSFPHGSMVTVTAQPNSGYSFSNWTDDLSGSQNPATILMDGNKTIGAQFSAIFRTITATSGTGGTISPSGMVSVQQGNDQSFTITADTANGYRIQDVLVDGISQGGISNYTFSNIQANHTIQASFTLNTYTLIVSPSANGTVNVSPDQASYSHGTVVTLTAVPNDGYSFSNWTGDLSGGQNPISVIMDADKTLSASFSLVPPVVHTITATAGANGTISPEGTITVNDGDDALFIFTSNEGYHVENVLVDGVSVGALSSHTISNVTSDHSIHADFAINTYTLTITPPQNGSVEVSLEQTAYDHGTALTITATPDAGYEFSDWTGDLIGNPNPASLVMDGNKTIGAAFALIPPTIYTISATHSAGGDISPNGTVNVTEGSEQTFLINASTGHHIQDVLIDGISQGTVSSYTFTNISGNHTIHVNFEINQYELNIETPENGSISVEPSGNSFAHGMVVTLTAAPSNGYSFSHWTGSLSGSQNPIPLVMDSDQSVGAVFTEIPPSITHIITATAGPNGTITPEGNVTVAGGDSATFVITPDTGYQIEDVKVDGVSIGAVSAYAFDNVSNAHTISATFVSIPETPADDNEPQNSPEAGQSDGEPIDDSPILGNDQNPVGYTGSGIVGVLIPYNQAPSPNPNGKTVTGSADSKPIASVGTSDKVSAAPSLSDEISSLTDGLSETDTIAATPGSLFQTSTRVAPLQIGAASLGQLEKFNLQIIRMRGGPRNSGNPIQTFFAILSEIVIQKAATMISLSV